MTTNFKSAEEWLKEHRSEYLPHCFITCDKNLITEIQSNTMREAARIATARASLHSNPDFIECFESLAVVYNNAAIAIEKGEYKPA